jgi:hypothetical protein
VKRPKGLKGLKGLKRLKGRKAWDFNCPWL